MIRKKKGALNLSIQTIVVVVLAMILLGLGIGFIKGLFKDITGLKTDVTAEIQEKIAEDLREGDRKLSVSRDVQLEAGEETIIGIGVANRKSQQITYGVTLNFLQWQGEAEYTGSTPDCGEPGCDHITFFYDQTVNKDLSATESKVEEAIVSATGGATGNYQYEAIVCVLDKDNPSLAEEDCEGEDGTGVGVVYARESFFVRVS
jgi:hypothetical protein